MKKRMISGLMAALMLFSAAGAVNEDTQEDEEAQQAAAEQTADAQDNDADAQTQPAQDTAAAAQPATTLYYQAGLPEGYEDDKLTDDLATVQTILEKRLSALGQTATVSLQADTMIVAVAFPAGADAAALGEALAAPGYLTVTDENGKVLLTGADVAAASAADADGAPALQLTFAAGKLAEAADGAGELTFTMDGRTIGTWVAETSADSDVCTLTGDLTEALSAQLAAWIGAGELPLPLSLMENEAEDDPTAALEDEPLFPDIAGHWAADYLQRAAELGLLKGANGKILPDNAVKYNEALVILNRVLNADETDDTTGLTAMPANAWYAEDMGKAIHIGLTDAQSARDFTKAATRAEAFELLARAFVYEQAEVDRSNVERFPDADGLTAEQQRAVAALIGAGVVNGNTDGTLNPSGQLTRAQFVTMLLRIVPEFYTAAEEQTDAMAVPTLQNGAVVSAAQAVLADTAYQSDLVFGAGTQSIALTDASVAGRIAVKGADAVKLTAAERSSITTLALAPAGTAAVTLDDSSSVQQLIVAGTDGEITFDGKAADLQITADGRTLALSGMTAAQLIVAGSGNTLTLTGDAGRVTVSGDNNVIKITGKADGVQITGKGNTVTVGGAAGDVTIAGGARQTALTLNGKAGSVVVAGIGSTVEGDGKAESIDVRAVDCTVTLTADAHTESIDPGLSGVEITLDAPASVKAGGSLLTVASFSGVSEPLQCTGQWYQDGKALDLFKNTAFALSEDATSRKTTEFTFTKDMAKSVTVGFQLSYENPSTGEIEEVYQEITVPIENYSDEWYYQRDVNRVLSLVSSDYRGNYTAAYAINNDYASYEKEVFVNAKGYSSSSQYLLWINRAYQHVNVFTGAKGNWKLSNSFLVGTGAMSTPTPVGVTTVSYKSAGGWTASTYTVRPVVGFYPGSGYAFHSRLCYPGTDTEYDHSGGYPVSHGCVRMNKADVQWIYNNVPVGTTVVIF